MENLPESVDINLLTSFLPGRLDGSIPGFEHIYNAKDRVFTIEPNNRLPLCYDPSRAKGKARAVAPPLEDDDDDNDNDDDNDDNDNAANMSCSSSHDQFTVPDELVELLDKWNMVTAAAGAARVEICNDIDDEPFPLSLEDFVYLEDTWEYGPGTCRPEDTEAFLLGCECRGNCSDVNKCECQSSQEYDAPMYNNGRFLFSNEGLEVIECNKNCSCRKNCQNRVAQQPRSVTIEVFKTRHNGWGARPIMPVKKGTVLGMYTGRVVLDKHRNSPEVLATAAANDGFESEEFDGIYSFDLDTRDHRENVDGLKFYSVVSEKTGNWTRFVNHSCEPNASIYPVLYDNPLESNSPHLVYVASRDILAREEITIDYNPINSGKRKSRKGGKKCMCKTKSCRGWI